MNTLELEKICKLIRAAILTSTSKAGSGHPTSSLSAVELMTVLFFGGFFRYDLEHPKNPANDRFILSKGHASPLLYSLFYAAGAVSTEELMTLRTIHSRLEGHPTPRFPYAEVATGSLGQGLSVGLGMALGMKIKFETRPNVFVLVGDSEMAEGQVWEATELASYYRAANLIAIVDVNRLGQRGETLLGWNLRAYKKRAEAFGWDTYLIKDGHSVSEITDVYKTVTERTSNGKPKMILAKTIKGKGVSFLENENGWHGKVLTSDELEKALAEIGEVDDQARGTLVKPLPLRSAEAGQTQLKSVTRKLEVFRTDASQPEAILPDFKPGDMVSTRKAYGQALAQIGRENKGIVALDAEVSNSTYANIFAKDHPNRFFEMFIAEQNMVSVALGLSKMGYIPFLSTFASFLTRTFDELRMAQYSKANLKVVGSHAGVFLGPDGPSQMGLEDVTMMRAIQGSRVLYPADAVSTAKLVKEMAKHEGIDYLRTTRADLPVLYAPDEEFPIGGLKILRQSDKDQAVVVAAGVTLHEALKAYDKLKEKNIFITVVDVYSVKPLAKNGLKKLAGSTPHFLVAEDHYSEGGVGEAIFSMFLAEHLLIDCRMSHLAVRTLPRSGSPEELLAREKIDASAIVSEIMKYAP